MTACLRERKSQPGGKIALAAKAQEGESGILGLFPNYGILDLFCDLG